RYDAADHEGGVSRDQPFEFTPKLSTNRYMGAREDGEADRVHRFLHRRRGDGREGGAEPRIDYLHPGVAESGGDDLRPPIVAVETGFAEQDPGCVSGDAHGS